jgi:putative lipase involved disintegration of autophagic bodies
MTPGAVKTKTKRGLTLRYGLPDECFESPKSQIDAKNDHLLAMKKIKERMEEWKP